MNSRPLYKTIWMLAALSLALTACQSKEQERIPTTSKPTATDTAKPGGDGNNSKPAPVEGDTTPLVSKLTGRPQDQAQANTRPLAVMVNNAPAARPQSGLLEADIVYEVLAEGGITRLVAIYQSSLKETKVGPIRSIRPYLIDLGESYHGVLVHAGGSTDAYALIQTLHKEDLDEISNAGAYFWRDKSRKAPHNLYSNPQKLLAGAKKRGYALIDDQVPAYTFYSDKNSALPEGSAVAGIEIKFLLNNYKVSYRHNASTHMYARFINGQPHKDLDSGKQLTAMNIVVLGANHKTLDNVGRLSVDMESGGKALLFQRGKVIRGEWVHKKNDIIRFMKDGKEVPFYPGQTYFNIVPNTPSFESHVQMIP
ncbi:hypothetical protein J2Z69_001902 [Paenibacillus shirakamiensis]|uniref:DUF3048 domain-containing protein n=1 Tax=Paenibacillus shirakamiensis TaxID=1265935 RepID=A0ABS4JGM1_9BACL|nr:DUF3048 domain-containing protein [Paenibacillus shirakamiensis]MBP2000871.1 hypothetical protein [Paenibacillus shirakamiensis]